MSFLQVKKNTDLANATLVAVSKTKPNSAILELYNEGQRHFGENRVQELVEKQENLPKDILWHQIGTLQTNKVKYIAPFVQLIHSVDSIKLAKTINKEALKCDRTIDILIQIKVALEETKQGINLSNAKATIQEIIDLELSNVNIKGMMAMASFTYDMEIVKTEFDHAKALFDAVKTKFVSELPQWSTLSMGMSGDYVLALECGSNMVRVGSLIFGKRG